jgi:hypothetical protein
MYHTFVHNSGRRKLSANILSLQIILIILEQQTLSVELAGQQTFVRRTVSVSHLRVLRYTHGTFFAGNREHIMSQRRGVHLHRRCLRATYRAGFKKAQFLLPLEQSPRIFVNGRIPLFFLIATEMVLLSSTSKFSLGRRYGEGLHMLHFWVVIKNLYLRFLKKETHEL